MDSFFIKINGKYLQGYDETRAVGKVGHSGWQPKAYELPAIVLTRDKNKARIVEGSINLRSDLDRIMNQIRFAGLVIQKLEIVNTNVKKEE